MSVSHIRIAMYSRAHTITHTQRIEEDDAYTPFSPLRRRARVHSAEPRTSKKSAQKNTRLSLGLTTSPTEAASLKPHFTSPLARAPRLNSAPSTQKPALIRRRSQLASFFFCMYKGHQCEEI
jgi:hypothetical protein